MRVFLFELSPRRINLVHPEFERIQLVFHGLSSYVLLVTCYNIIVYYVI